MPNGREKLSVEQAAVTPATAAMTDRLRAQLRAAIVPPRSAALLALGGAVCAGLFLALALVGLILFSETRTPGALDKEALYRWLLADAVLIAIAFALVAHNRHRALVVARRAEDSFRDLYDSISEGVFRSTLDGKMISANPALVRLNGYDSEADLIRCCNDIAAEWYVDPNRRAEIHQMLLKNGTVTNVVSEVYRHKTRERIWIEESVRLVRDERTGEPLYYQGNVSEITETMRRLELQDHYDKIASIMSGCLYQHRERPDGTRSMPYASIGLYHIFGVRPEEVAENTDVLRDLIHPDDGRRIRATLEYSAATLTPWQCEYRIRARDGTEKWLFAHSVPERESDGSTLWHGYIVDISERKRSEAKIYELAHFDALTLLPNRVSLRERLGEALAPREGGRRAGALLFLDLDHFKVLNDTKGHHVGDLLLREIAGRIRSCAAPADVVARIGGDEFVVLTHGVDAHDGEALARQAGERILAAIDQPFVIGEDRFQTTASMGAVLFSGAHHTVDDVLKQADLALYEAKAAGRGTMRFFKEEMQSAAADRLILTSDLRRAHREGELALHYQPVVDAAGRCVGAEALLRWRHPTRGLISAGDFIPLAEQSGFMGSIDNWVLRAACATLKQWEQEPLTRDLQLAVNVSAREMNRVELVGAVKEALEESGARASRLTLELTEHVILDDFDAVTMIMQKLQALGLRFALDDFGTGYSSLSYLKRLPIDTLKIDKSFVRDIETDKNDREIVQTILNIARSLKIPVIAEGVETELQAILLRQFGCQAFQGYFFGKPMPRAAFIAFLETQPAAKRGKARRRRAQA
ncbi:MAG: sensor domain-containing protein [Propylenella sp.]